MSILTLTDSYKYSHYLQYPPGTEYVSSYIESRGGPFKRAKFFGLQEILKKHFLSPIDRYDIDEAEETATNHGEPFNREGWEYILKEHEGYLPLSIEAVPEGYSTPIKNVLVQVRNTDPKVPWLTSFVETILMQVWYPTTVCTLSSEIRDILLEFLEESCESPEEAVKFMLHDFGCRGVSSMESAGIGGLAHLVNFLGTDTLPALVDAELYYGESNAGFSIPAMEHSTVTCWGRDGEVHAFRNMIQKCGGPGKTVAMVIDSYDAYKAVKEIICDTLKDEILSSGTKCVVRPDSGQPQFIVPDLLRHLNNAFGGTTNHKGYRVLHPQVRVIQGDGMSLDSIRTTTKAVLDSEFSAENVAYGLGGGLLQKIDRDTMKFAMKASAAQINSVWYDVYKDPATDPGKKSKKGILGLSHDPVYKTLKTVRADESPNTLLTEVYRNGKLLVDETLTTIRNRKNEVYSSE